MPTISPVQTTNPTVNRLRAVTVAGLVVPCAGILVQRLSGVEMPAVPPGAVIMMLPAVAPLRRAVAGRAQTGDQHRRPRIDPAGGLHRLSAGVIEGLWRIVAPPTLAAIIGLSIALLAVVIGLTFDPDRSADLVDRAAA